MPLSRRLLIGFTVFVAATTVALSAFGATAHQLDMAGLVNHSDVIVIAQVNSTSAAMGDDGRVYTTIDFETQDVLLGPSVKSFQLRQIGGVDPDTGIGTHAPGLPHFLDGERVFLFLEQTSSQLVLTGLAQGKFTVARGPDGESDFVIPQLRGLRTLPSGFGDADPLPSTKPPTLTTHDSLYSRTHRLDLFKEAVRQTIDALHHSDSDTSEGAP